MSEDNPVIQEIPAHTFNIKDRLTPPDINELKDAHAFFKDAFSTEITDDTFEKVRKQLAQGAAVIARKLRLLPALGISKKPKVEKAEVAFTEKKQEGDGVKELPMVVLNPYGSVALAIEVIYCTPETDDVGLEVGLMREQDDLGVKVVENLVELTPNGELRPGGGMILEVYRNGREVYIVQMGDDGKVIEACEIEYSDEAPQTSSVIPKRERRRTLWDRKVEDTGPEDAPGGKVTSVKLSKETIDVKALRDIFKTVDPEGNRVDTDLKQQLVDVIGVNFTERASTKTTS